MGGMGTKAAFVFSCSEDATSIIERSKDASLKISATTKWDKGVCGDGLWGGEVNTFYHEGHKG